MAGRPRLLPSLKEAVVAVARALGVGGRRVVRGAVVLITGVAGRVFKTALTPPTPARPTLAPRVTVPPLPDPPGTGVLVEAGAGQPSGIEAVSIQHSAFGLAES